MKTRLYSIALSSSLVIAGGAFMLGNSKAAKGTLLYENIEALSQEESLDPETCFETVTAAEGRWVRYCPGCVIVEGKPTLLARESTCIPRN